MKLKPSCDLPAFLQTVRQCENDVVFVTLEGDVLNLNSELSKYIFLAAASSPNGAFLPNGTIKCKSKADAVRLQEYLEQ